MGKRKKENAPLEPMPGAEKLGLGFLNRLAAISCA